MKPERTMYKGGVPGRHVLSLCAYTLVVGGQNRMRRKPVVTYPDPKIDYGQRGWMA